MPHRQRRPIFPAVLALIGGGAIVTGCLLTWLSVANGVSVGRVAVTGTPKGTDLLLGKVAVGVGMAIVVFGLSLLVVRGARRPLGILLLVGGILAIATAAYVAASPKDRYVQFAAAKEAPAGQTEAFIASLTHLFEVSNLQADPGFGLYVVMGGGLLSAFGGLAALFGRRGSRAVPEEPGVSEPVQSSSDTMAEMSLPGGSASEVRPAEEAADLSMEAAIPGSATEGHGLGETEATARLEEPTQLLDEPTQQEEPAEPPEAKELAEPPEAEDPARPEEPVGAVGPRSDAVWVARPADRKKRGLRIFRRDR